jgi:D-alanine-D-alanine ligase
MSQVLRVTEHRTVVNHAGDFGRVAVLYGGRSAEREVSLDTGKAVLGALLARGVDAVGWDPAEHALSDFAAAGFDRVWIALHGPGGEDGAIQGALQWLGLPYTGSGVMASALAMDKVRSKRLHAVLAAEDFGYPLILKPACQGSSVGMTKVFDPEDLNGAVDLALSFDDVAIVERCIVGDEYTVAVLQGQALPSIRIETPRVFYDYRAKYESDRTRYHCPGTERDDLEQQYAALALAAFAELGCSGWGRVDFMTGSNGQRRV